MTKVKRLPSDCVAAAASMHSDIQSLFPANVETNLVGVQDNLTIYGVKGWWKPAQPSATGIVGLITILTPYGFVSDAAELSALVNSLTGRSHIVDTVLRKQFVAGFQVGPNNQILLFGLDSKSKQTTALTQPQFGGICSIMSVYAQNGHGYSSVVEPVDMLGYKVMSHVIDGVVESSTLSGAINFVERLMGRLEPPVIEDLKENPIRVLGKSDGKVIWDSNQFLHMLETQ